MAMVQPKSQKLRLFITHFGLLIFIAAIMFPLLMVIAISLREGNFATGSLIPEKSPGSTGGWRWALALNTLMAASRRPLPGSVMAVELGENRRDHRNGHRGAIHHLCLRLCPYALPR